MGSELTCQFEIEQRVPQNLQHPADFEGEADIGVADGVGTGRADEPVEHLAELPVSGEVGEARVEAQLHELSIDGEPHDDARPLAEGGGVEVGHVEAGDNFMPMIKVHGQQTVFDADVIDLALHGTSNLRLEYSGMEPGVNYTIFI